MLPTPAATNAPATPIPQGIVARDETPGLVDTFYNMVTDIYEWGWGQSFHFAPRCASHCVATSLHRATPVLPPTPPPSISHIPLRSIHGRRLSGQDDHCSEVAHEVHLAAALQVMPGERVLDAGCGVGGPMRRIAARTGAKVTGVTINDYQVSRARKHNKDLGLEAITEVIQGNFLELPFPDNVRTRAPDPPPRRSLTSPLT